MDPDEIDWSRASEGELPIVFFLSPDDDDDDGFRPE